MGGFLLLIYSQVSICQVLSTFHRAAIYGEGDGYMGTAYLEGAVNITWITNYGKKCRPGALTDAKDPGTFLALRTLPVMGRFVSILHSTTTGIQKEDKKKTVLHVLVCQYSGSLTLHPDL